jgi:hypothetical protein
MIIAAFYPFIKGQFRSRACQKNTLTSSALDRGGAHIDDDNQIKRIPEQFAYATRVENEEQLWTLSEELAKEKFVY